MLCFLCYWFTNVIADSRVNSKLQFPLSGYTPWWRHQMKTFSALLALCAGNSPVPGEFPTQSPVTRSFDVFLICVWTNGWVNNGEAGDLRCYRAHYEITLMHLSEKSLVSPQTVEQLGTCLVNIVSTHLTFIMSISYEKRKFPIMTLLCETYLETYFINLFHDLLHDGYIVIENSFVFWNSYR